MPDYICQRCRLPLTIDPSLEDLSNAQMHLLTTSYAQRPDARAPAKEPLTLPDERRRLYKEAVKNSAGQPLLKQHASNAYSATKGSSDDDSFVILSEREQPIVSGAAMNATPMSEKVSSLHNVFNVVSSKYEIDYPVCTDCANVLIEGMNQQFDELTKEKDTYLQFLKKLTGQAGPNEAKSQESLDELKRLQEEEAKLLRELGEAEKEGESLKADLATAETDLKSLNEQEKALCLKQNKYELELAERSDELDRVKAQYESNNDQLDMLRRADVFSDTFDISTDGKFGTINGLRLGSLDETKVSWHEINAALGQVVLLLYTCIRILQMDLKGYVLVPMGSTSRIDKIERDPKNPALGTKTPLDLYSTGEFSIGRIFTHNKLDPGMVALLAVMRKIAEHFRHLDSSKDLPYTMTRDKIAGYNVRPSARASNEEWTAACNYLLKNAKWILSYSEEYYVRG